jgi:regulator of cell morphogenesis and NO signaling
MTTISSKRIGDVVAENWQTADVFDKYNIDFCCKGNRSIEEACAEKGISLDAVVADLEETLHMESATDDNYSAWALDQLADHIESKHHKYVETHLPMIRKFLHKTAQVHGSEHPELLEMEELFNASAIELTAHMKKEEFLLFPHIRRMVKSMNENESISHAHLNSVVSPIDVMKHEHETEGDRFQKMNDLSNHYTIPKDACNTYRVTYEMLKQFEEDLHLHIHLENNILFPQAIALEEKLAFH